MMFEIKEKDLLARIGKLRTKSGVIETPLLFPVVNPAVESILPQNINDFEALITNAYLLKRNFKNQPVKEGLHKFLNFNSTIMTDSGAYQILVYGDIEITSSEIVEYQEEIDTDIATILDFPTGWNDSREEVELSVNKTLKSAKELFQIKTRKDILWVGPVQGGRCLDLVKKSSIEMGKMPFQIYALGSPTEVMESYRFDILVDMIMTAKMNLPIEKPLHLFGAGHPFMFSLAVALGCDLFDSAAYTLYGREDRYMTENGTLKLKELEYFPCVCPKCSKATTKDVQEMPKKERQTFLSEHNLYMCTRELRQIKNAIKMGKLWEHLELRTHGHPALFQALKKLEKYKKFIEKHSPIVGRRGLFFYNSVGLMRPEIVRYRERLKERYSPPEKIKSLLLISQPKTKPFHKSKEFKKVVKLLQNSLGDKMNETHFCFYAAPFGIIPIELDEVYPLSQNEVALPLDIETIEYVAKEVANYIQRTNYSRIVFLHDEGKWNKTVLSACRKVCLEKNIKFECLNQKEGKNSGF